MSAGAERARRLGLPITLGSVFAFLLGGLALGSGEALLHSANSNEFCYGCHSIEMNTRGEYEASSHFHNPSGVRASCADCHLPQDGALALAWAKAKAALDVIPEFTGKLSTPAKYEAHRGEMAQAVWEEMRDNDSAFCQSCHGFAAMNLAAQERRPARHHARARESGQTCIQCHYGLVHKLPENADEMVERIFATN
ncbi:MAG: NapC/NirT family cytochrome c [Halieaceae bacterium]|jgi:nitrate/TMAO reductase-like tetraheme cytochrome c subunit|nr:NapC/NirT family cytochrome c [Halieaceae bacterium]